MGPRLEGCVAKVEKNVDATAAMSAAMNNASMPNLQNGEKAVDAGVGTAGGHSTISVGIVIATTGGMKFRPPAPSTEARSHETINFVPKGGRYASPRR